MRTLIRLAVAGALVAGLAGCGAGGYQATPVPGKAATTPAATSSTPAPVPECGNPLASYAPSGPLPTAGQMEPGTKMAEIQARGRLVAGVSADTLLLGARNPVTGAIEGFDIEMLEAISQAIFGRPDRIEFKVISAAQRIPALRDQQVDIVARNMTINCARWEQIAFSTEYYRSGQKVLVPLGSTVRGLQDLGGRRVCAPAGSTSLASLAKFPQVVPVPADTHTGCLVLFQQGKADAITGDDTVLAGLTAQDPYAEVVKGPAIGAEPYGLGISQKHPEFVRFVNSVLEQIRGDGRWTAAYNTWLKDALGPAPAPPRAVYGRNP